jgi:hypothetical protein
MGLSLYFLSKIDLLLSWVLLFFIYNELIINVLALFTLATYTIS